MLALNYGFLVTIQMSCINTLISSRLKELVSDTIFLL